MDTGHRNKIRVAIKRMARRWQRVPIVTRSRTVRYAFPAMVAVSTILGLALTISSSDISYVRLESDPPEVHAGDEFVLSVYASANVPTNAVDIQIAYPPEQMNILRIDKGESILTIWTQEPYAQNGRIYLRGGVFRRGFIGEHLIARIHAKATQSGVAKILTSKSTFIAGDGLGTVVDVTKTGGEELSMQVDSSQNSKIESTVRIGLVTDVDGDGDVDLSDIEAFLTAWRNRSSIFDFNNDGRMTFRDFAILLADSFFK